MYSLPKTPHERAYNAIALANNRLSEACQVVTNIAGIIDLDVKFESGHFYFPQFEKYNSELDFFKQITLERYLSIHLGEIDFPVSHFHAVRVADFFGLTGNNRNNFLSKAVSEEAFQSYLETERRINQD